MLKKFKDAILKKQAKPPSPEGFFLDCRCSNCGEEFHLFINTGTEILPHYGEKSILGYSLKKQIFGTRCRNVIEVRMSFDAHKRELQREIENGEFL